MAPPPIAWTGLSVLFTPSGVDPVADIVFVHGLQGHPQRTWSCARPASTTNPGVREGSPSGSGNVGRKPVFRFWKRLSKAKRNNDHNPDKGTGRSEDVYWPKDLLPTDCPEARIMAWGYDTVITRGITCPTNKGTIFSHARDLLFDLHRECPLDRPLIFVAHSLGGIVVKEMLRRSQSSDEVEIQNIVQFTRGIIFFGTPHRGSAEMAALGDVVRKVASVALRADSNPTILRALGLDSPELELCRESFTSQWRKYGFQVKTFQEGLGTTGLNLGPLNKKVVPDTSSSFDDALEHAETIQANHMGMTKFFSSDDPGYRKVRGELRRLVQAISASKPNHMDDSNAPPLLSGLEYKQGIRLPSHINLSLSDPPLSKGDLCKIPHLERSLEWFLKDPEYQIWKDRVPWSFLWLHGGPGAGKTVIMSFLLHNLPMNFGYADRWDVAAAFCRPGDTQFGLVASLVLQLVESRVQEMQTAFPLSELVQNPNIDCRLIWMLLDAAITESSNRDTVILIDGLDELENEDRASFLKNLHYFGDRIAHTASNTAKVRILIASRSYADLNDTFGDLPNIEPGKERRECLKSLFFEEWNARECRVESVVDAGEWLSSNPQFTSWEQGETSDVLWIEGKPGSGKSTLVKKLWNRLELEEANLLPPPADGSRQPQQLNTDHSSICSRFFYSSRGGPRERDHKAMFQSLIHQVLTKNGNLFPVVQRCYREVRSRALSETKPHWTYEDWTYDDLKSALQSLQEASFPVKIIILIDGFDESDHELRDDALNVLTDLVSRQSLCTVKLLISSRPGNDLQLILGRFHHITLQNENEGDIRMLVDTKIEKLRHMHESIANSTQARNQRIPDRNNSRDIFSSIKDYIVDASWGVILWVILVLDDLERCVRRGGYSQVDLDRRVRKLPKELGGPDGFYKAILESLMEQFRSERGQEEDIKRGWRIFAWATFPNRPITTMELNDALAIPADLTDPSCHDINQFRQHDLARGIIANCGGLVEIREGPQLHHTVQLIHHTVKDFLLDQTRLAAPFDLDKVRGDMEITLTCSRYIAVAVMAPATQAVADKTCSDAEKIVQHLSDHELLEYAITNLTNHPDYLEDDEAAIVHKDFGEFVIKLQRNGGCYGSLLLGAWIESLDWPTKLALGGDKKVARHCLQLCLVTAALRGKTGVVRLLLALGADINTGVSHFGAPLQAAARQGEEKTVIVLLGAGANVDMPGGHYGSALQAASALGHVEVVSLLVNAGANINARGGHYGNALQAASARGKKDIVHLLLDRGAEVDALCDHGNTALQAASANGHTRVAEILINAKAKVNIKGGSHGSALHAACEEGHEDIVRLLLGNGADVNLTSDHHRTPLQLALANSSRGIASLLRSDGGKPDDNGETSCASRVSPQRDDDRCPLPRISDRKDDILGRDGNSRRGVLSYNDTPAVDPGENSPQCYCGPKGYSHRLSPGTQGSGARVCRRCNSSGRIGWEDGNGWGHRRLEDQSAPAGYYYAGKQKVENERNSSPFQRQKEITAGRETRTARLIMGP